MKQLSVMLKPTSSRCDMGCAYCFYADVAASRKEAFKGMMSRETVSALIRNIFVCLEKGDSITFAFQGGEPRLAGLDFFTFFTEEVAKIAVSGVKTEYAIQTNGLGISDEWCKFFLQNNFLVGLSIDGGEALHDTHRKDLHGNGTHSRVMATKQSFDKFAVPYNVLCVLTYKASVQAVKIWDFVIKEKIKFVQFIPCLEPLESTNPAAERTGYVPLAYNQNISLTADGFYRFYSVIFPLWKREALRDNFVQVRLFEDLALMFLSGHGMTCGVAGRCQPQIVVEADGSVYPCDFYVLDEYKSGELTRQTLREVFEATVSGTFMHPRELPPECQCCTYVQWCHGGCKRMNKAVYGKRCGMKAFLEKYLDELLTVYRRLIDRSQKD